MLPPVYPWVGVRWTFYKGTHGYPGINNSFFIYMSEELYYKENKTEVRRINVLLFFNMKYLKNTSEFNKNKINVFKENYVVNYKRLRNISYLRNTLP